MGTNNIVDYVIHVRTGDRKRAGTDANIRIILHGNDGTKTEKMRLHNVFKNDFECGQLDEFVIQKQMGLETVERIELWRDNFGFGSRWYCDYIIVQKKGSDEKFTFPIYRWVKAEKHHIFRLHDTMLPQQDPQAEQRWSELQKKRKKYVVAQKVTGGPAQVGCKLGLMRSSRVSLAWQSAAVYEKTYIKHSHRTKGAESACTFALRIVYI